MLLFTFTPTVFSQSNQPLIEMQIEPIFEGNFKYGEWLLLWVTLENQGTDIELEISANIEHSGGGGVYATEVSLPAGSRKQVPFYIIPNNFSREILIQAISDGQEILSEVVSVTPNQNNYYLIGITSPEIGPLSQITRIENGNSSRKVVSFNLSPLLLPEKSLALNTLDAIILNDTDTSQLSEDQKQALLTWVQNGGRLVIGGGPGLDKTITGLPTELIQFANENLSEIEHLNALETFSNDESILVNGPFTINQVSVNSGKSLAEQENLPVVHEWFVGNGYVDLISLDIVKSPFNAWSGTTIFWQNLLSPGAAFPMWMPADSSIRQIRAGSMYYPLTNQPSLDLPSVRSLAILLLVYIILVGPVNYLVLRWRKKFQLAWVTIPLLTALFTAGAFGLAFVLRGNDILINNISIINLNTDGTARVTGYVGVFSPSQSSYSLEVSGSPLLSPATQGYYDPWSSVSPANSGEAHFYQGNPAKVTNLNINQWSLNSFNVEALTAQPGEISSNLTLQKGKLTGTIENQTPYTISDTVLIFGVQAEIIGDLEPYQTKEIDITFSNGTNGIGAPATYQIIEKAASGSDTVLYSREFEQKRSILDGALQPYGYWLGPDSGISSFQSQEQFQLSSFYLIGWMEEAPIEITIDGKAANQKSLSLLTYFPPLNVDPQGFSLPPSSIPGKLADTSKNAGYCGGTDTYVYLENGEATLDFTIPEYLMSTQIDNLTLNIWDDMNWNAQSDNITLSIYNWELDTWTEIDEVSNGKTIISDPAGLVNENGAVQVKVTRDNFNSGGCVYLDLGLDGSLDN
jgi:hypothetical protein